MLNCDAVLEMMKETGCDPRFIKVMNEAVRDMTEQNITPYKMALGLVDLACTLIHVGLPNEEFRGFGQYLDAVSKNVEEYGSFREELVRMSAYIPAPSDEELAEIKSWDHPRD